MDVSALAAMAAQQSVEALKASSQRHLAARARAMSPMSGPKASGRTRGKALLAVDNAGRLTEEVSLAQALESIPTPLTTPPRIQSLQYTTLTAHSPPPSFSPARRGDTAVPSNLSLWLGETLQALRPEEVCGAAPAAASGPKSTEGLPEVLPRRRLSGKRSTPLRGPLLEEIRCTASTLGQSATTEPKTPMPRCRLSGKGPAHRRATPALPSQPVPVPSSHRCPSDEVQDLQASCLPSFEAATDRQRQQRQQQRGKDRHASQRKDKSNSLRLGGQAISQGQVKRDEKRIIDLDCSLTTCSKKNVPPADDSKRPFEQQCRHQAKRLPQPEPRQYRVARNDGRDSMRLEARAAKRPRSHNYMAKRLKPLKMPVSNLGKRRRRTGLAEVSSVVGAVLACLHSATPVPVVAVDIPLGEDID